MGALTLVYSVAPNLICCQKAWIFFKTSVLMIVIMKICFYSLNGVSLIIVVLWYDQDLLIGAKD